MSSISLTSTEQKLLANAWQCMKSLPELDIDKLATIMGHTNKGTTKNMVAAVRKKLASADENGISLVLPASAPSTPTKPTPSKKRRVVQSVEITPSGITEEMSESTVFKEPAAKKKRGTKKAPVKHVSPAASADPDSDAA